MSCVLTVWSQLIIFWWDVYMGCVVSKFVFFLAPQRLHVPPSIEDVTTAWKEFSGEGSLLRTAKAQILVVVTWWLIRYERNNVIFWKLLLANKRGSIYVELLGEDDVCCSFSFTLVFVFSSFRLYTTFSVFHSVSSFLLPCETLTVLFYIAKFTYLMNETCSVLHFSKKIISFCMQNELISIL